MPIYMDIHTVPGVKAKGVAAAHQQDLLIEEENNCKCMTYWVDEVRETVFCLIEAPDKDAVKDLHRKAHGLIPNKVIEVSSSIVQSFLGRIYDPESAEIEDGLKVFAEPSFRVLLMTDTEDPIVLKHRLGVEETQQLVQQHNDVIRNIILQHGGSEVEHARNGFVISFPSAARAVACSSAILAALEVSQIDQLGFKLSINGGEPVGKSAQLFGDTVQKGQYLAYLAPPGTVIIADGIKQLLSKEKGTNGQKTITLPVQDEALLECLFQSLEEHWQQPDFDGEIYCHEMAMSKSQLYRKCIALTGVSPNILLKEFRLEKAKGLLKKQKHSISQVTFESGFTSPSYFTKCFKKKYGLLPIQYVELCQA